MPKKDTPAKKTRKKSTKAKASARASVVSNIQNKIVIGDLGGSKKPRRRRAPNKPKGPTQPQIPVASYSSPCMTFAPPPSAFQNAYQYNYEPPRYDQRMRENPLLLEASRYQTPANALLTGSTPPPSLLEAPQQYARLEDTSMPFESEEVPPQSTDLTIREPQIDSSIYNPPKLFQKPKKINLLDDGSAFSINPVERAPSIPIPKKKLLIEDDWASYENPLPFTNEDIPTDTSTFEDITSTPTIRPARGRPKSDDQMRDLKAKLHDVNNQLKRGGIKKESTMNRLLEKKQKYEDEIATLQNIPVSLSAKLARKPPSAEDEREDMGMEDFDASAMFSKPLIKSVPSPLVKPLVESSTSAKKPLIYKGETTQNEEDDEEDIIEEVPKGRKGASMRRKEEWDALPEGTQFELKYNKSGRIYTKQGNGLVDADGIQYKSLNDAVRKYKASIGDTKQFGSAWSMFKIV